MNFTGDCPIILMSDTDDRNGRKKFRSHKYETGKITHLQVMVMVLIIKGKILFFMNI